LRERRYFVLSRDLVYWIILEIFKRRLWKRPSLTIEAPMEKQNGANFTGDFQRQMKESSGKGASFSPWELCEGNLDGELLY
jgi:hypothetical protein